jgi:hypothetical protein
VRYVCGYIKKHVYPYNQGQPIKPAAVRDKWRAAIEVRGKTSAMPNGSANGYHHDPDPRSLQQRADDQAREIAAWRKQRETQLGGGS